jgi:hypothetical protein
MGQKHVRMGFGRHKFQHEPIFYYHVAEQKDAGMVTKRSRRSGRKRSPRRTGCIPRPSRWN